MSKTFEVIFKEFHNSETFVVSKTMLEDYKAKAAQEERERIISLLDQRLCVCSFRAYCKNDDHLHPADVLALIKGENE